MSEEKAPSGIICEILKGRFGDCSNGGLSHLYQEVTLILPEGGPFKPSEKAPAVELYQAHGVVKAKAVGEKRWMMFGGCFIYSSDGRFPHDYPVKLFDRYEQ